MSAGYEISSVLLVAAVAVAAVQDIRHRVIPNGLTYSLLLAGAALSVLDGRLHQSAVAIGLCMVLVFPLYLAGVLGGGDLKLLGGISLFGDWHALLEVLLISTVLGAVLALVYLAVSMGGELLPSNRQPLSGDGTGDVRGCQKAGVRHAKLSIPLAGPIAVAVICSHVLGSRWLV